MNINRSRLLEICRSTLFRMRYHRVGSGCREVWDDVLDLRVAACPLATLPHNYSAISIWMCWTSGWNARDFLRDELGLTLHEGKTVICNVRYGVEYLGAYLKPWRRYVSPRNAFWCRCAPGAQLLVLLPGRSFTSKRWFKKIASSLQNLDFVYCMGLQILRFFGIKAIQKLWEGDNPAFPLPDKNQKVLVSSDKSSLLIFSSPTVAESTDFS